MADNCSVRVAVRVRPLVPSEISKGCKDILDVIEENNQIIVKSAEKAFTFNFVLPSIAAQEELYHRTVQPLIENLLKGYNVTILAYGQTGSGKTYSMGTSNDGKGGVIPMAVKDIFQFTTDNFSFNFGVTVSFMELYQEVLYDLLSGKSREQCVLDIREDPNKGIYIPNLTEIPVNNVEEVMKTLQKGSLIRVTGATAMNQHSSRSHAIFIINIAMNHKTDCRQNKQARLNLVDLAGSERPKKTGAAGATFKEGVNINKGLLALGNVISALGDEKGCSNFIPYRDSSLTRLLKDSLGGNSITLMIACVSPADYNLDETLSTLRYADRARRIKNKPIVNQDPKVAEINSLKKTIQQLQLQIVGQGGPIICSEELETMKKELTEFKKKVKDLSYQLTTTLVEKIDLHERVLFLQKTNEHLSSKLTEIKEQYEAITNSIKMGIESNEDVAVLKENLVKLLGIQKQFEEMHVEQLKAHEEMKSHESSYNKLLINSNTINNEEVDEKAEIHTNRQIDLNMQLTELQRQLVLKEGLANQLLTNNQHIIDYESIAENEARVAKLEKEKEDLLQIVEKFGNDKMSTHRKKRIQELEQQLTQLKKKLQEQNTLIKLKAKDEERINKLNHEIIQMKKMKVKLVRTMKEESEKFRKWKLQKEQEYQKLKRQDLKKDNEINRMKAMHTKQQNVFKRRVEEAEAINRRLKSILNMKKQVQNTKNNEKSQKIEPWLEEEFECHISVVEAEATLQQLLSDRATLKQQLDMCDPNSDEYKNLEEDIELRSVQIQDIQQKLLDSGEEPKSNTRYDRFQSMAEAKFGLKFLFSKVSDLVKEKLAMQQKLNDAQYSLNEANENRQKLQAEVKNLSDNHAQDLISIQQDYENKTAILLRQLRDTYDGENKAAEQNEVYKIQQERIEAQENKIQQLLEEKLNLQKSLDEIRELAKKQAEKENKEPNEEINDIPEKIRKTDKKEQRGRRVIPKNYTFTEENAYEGVEFHTPERTYRSGSSIASNDNEKILTLGVPDNQGILTESVEETENIDSPNIDDTIKDPDWRKTPLGKRILEAKRRGVKSLVHDEARPVKRSSDGGCTCQTGCSGSKCGCRKIKKKCNSSCRCNRDICVN